VFCKSLIGEGGDRFLATHMGDFQSKKLRRLSHTIVGESISLDLHFVMSGSTQNLNIVLRK
jgi:hypothetical protein